MPEEAERLASNDAQLVRSRLQAEHRSGSRKRFRDSQWFLSEFVRPEIQITIAASDLPFTAVVSRLGVGVPTEIIIGECWTMPRAAL